MAYFMIDLLGTETAAGVFVTARLSLIQFKCRSEAPKDSTETAAGVFMTARLSLIQFKCRSEAPKDCANK
jgi:hypothetical protein